MRAAQPQDAVHHTASRFRRPVTSGSAARAQSSESVGEDSPAKLQLLPNNGHSCSPARRSGSNYGWGAGAKPDGVVAVAVGLATLVSGAVGGVVVVIVCSVACGASGAATCAGSAELTSPKIAPSTPMATTALTPIAADPHVHCAVLTLTTPFGR